MTPSSASSPGATAAIRSSTTTVAASGWSPAPTLLTATTGSLGELVDGTPVVVAPGDPAIDVLSRMVDDGVDHVPVLDDSGRLVGICTRGDLLRARRDADRADHREPGWIGRLRVGGA